MGHLSDACLQDDVLTWPTKASDVLAQLSCPSFEQSNKVSTCLQMTHAWWGFSVSQSQHHGMLDRNVRRAKPPAASLSMLCHSPEGTSHPGCFKV